MLRNLGTVFVSKESEAKRKKGLELSHWHGSKQDPTNCFKELQALDESQLEALPVEVCPVLFSKGDVVAVKHYWKRYFEPLFPAILREELHRGNDGILERTMHLNWLESSEEDLLVYIVGNEDDNNPPQCILDIASVDPDGGKYLLSKNEEQRLKSLANGSTEGDSESSDAEESDDDNRGDDDDQPTRFEVGRSRSGRRVTRYVGVTSSEKLLCVF